MSDDHCVYLFDEINSVVGSLNPSTFSSITQNTGAFFTVIFTAALIFLFASFFGAQRSSRNRIQEKGVNQARGVPGFGFRKDFEDWRDDDANSGGL